MACCRNVEDFRALARRRLPGPIFHYIDGGADDETTLRRNTAAYEDCDLVPNVLAGLEGIDLSTTVLGQKLAMPLFCAPTALHRLFHHEGERAVAKAAEKAGTMFGISSLGTVSIEEIGAAIATPKMFQLYVHKDQGLTNSMIERCRAANFEVLALTVDTITGGNRERDLITGFTSPPRLTLKSLRKLRPAPTLGLQLFHAREIRPAAAQPLRQGRDEHRHFAQRLPEHHARPGHELEGRRANPQVLGPAVLPQGHHERRRCQESGRNRRQRHHGLEPRRPSAGRIAQSLRPTWPRSSMQWASNT